MKWIEAVRNGCIVLLTVAAVSTAGQPAPVENPLPGDVMIETFMNRQADQIEDTFLEGISCAADWQRDRPRFKEEYLYMLGLWPLPEKTDLRATVTGTLDKGEYTVELLHYQSKPGLYVTGNLYRPARIEPGEKLPAVLYVVGHTNRGKTAYQSHGIWFAKHGYVCLVLDTVGQGEIPGLHAGTYRGQRWWWYSRGYTPAGVECWNGIRSIDYLTGRADVDPERIAVTGFSGGGAATYWIAAADDRIKAAVAVSGMADLRTYVGEKWANRHCDCMFMYNTFRWPWARIAALIAPRPLLVVNSDNDKFFPMPANERLINHLERIYGLMGAGDRVDSVVSKGKHGYRRDIREAAYRFINTHLKNDPRPVTDSEEDLPTGEEERTYPIPLEELHVFKDKLPADALNPEIGRHFVPAARPTLPSRDDFYQRKSDLMAELYRVSFHSLVDSFRGPAKLLGKLSEKVIRISAEEGIEYRLTRITTIQPSPVKRVVLAVISDDEGTEPDWLSRVAGPDNLVFLCQPRGIGPTCWSRKDPPNFVTRAHALLGRTVDEGRIRDIIAAARRLQDELIPVEGVHLAGRGYDGVLAGYAALFEPTIGGGTLIDPQMTHMDPQAPQFLNVLRVCDIPDALGMIAPRPLTIVGKADEGIDRIEAIYKAADAAGAFTRQ